ncbi:MAG: HlyD family efflux transporter periplasmic adaptor subunit [Chloroflexi bacterium]|nr:HlyD family efflux transporter periplasmic adaptor subunit [Chloroflexota bacterium]
MMAQRHGRLRPFAYGTTYFWLSLAFLLLLSACGGAEEPLTGEVVTVTRGDLAASASASGQVQAAREATLSLLTPGVVHQVTVRVGDVVTEGQLLASLDTFALELGVANAAQNVAVREAQLAQLLVGSTAEEISAAQAAVASAQANLDALLAGPRSEEITAAEADVFAAQAAVVASAAQAADAQSGPSAAQLEAARAQLLAAEYQLEQAQAANDRIAVEQTHTPLVNAQEALAVAQANYNALLAGADPNTVRVGQAEVSSATAQRDRAQAALDSLLAGATEAQISAAELQIAQAEAQLDSLLNLRNEEPVRVAEAQLIQAELALADAQEQLAKAQIIAPFDGVVTAVYIREGELASGRAIDVMDTTSLQVVLNIDEVDIALISEGQAATLRLETWPDTLIPSTVGSIAPAGSNTTTGLVNYQARLNLDTTLPVRVGMTANAILTTAERTAVLLVPNRAITANRQTGQFFVYKVIGQNEDGSYLTEEVEVRVGLRDGQQTELLEGVTEGEELLISRAVQGFGPGQ